MLNRDDAAEAAAHAGQRKRIALEDPFFSLARNQLGAIFFKQHTRRLSYVLGGLEETKRSKEGIHHQHVPPSSEEVWDDQQDNKSGHS